MNSKNMNKIFLAALAMLLTASVAVAAPASKGGDKSTAAKGELQHRFEQMIILELSNKLDLPQDKEDKLFDILRAHFRQRRELAEQQFANMKALREAYDSPSPSDAKLKALLDKVTSVQSEQMKLEADLNKKLRSLLTVKEQAKFVLEWPSALDNIRGMIKGQHGKGMGWGKSRGSGR